MKQVKKNYELWAGKTDFSVVEGGPLMAPVGAPTCYERIETFVATEKEAIRRFCRYYTPNLILRNATDRETIMEQHDNDWAFN